MTDANCHHQPPGLARDALHEIVTILEHELIARDTWRIRLAAPEIARRAQPGQFFMLRGPGLTDPLLGRPFALYDTILDESGTPVAIDIVYLVVGKMTHLMRNWQSGDRVEIWGPLGNGFPVPETKRLIFVAGGIGQTPFLATGREALGKRTYGGPNRPTVSPVSQLTMCYGARSSEYLAGLDDFAAADIDVRVATDDGSAGTKGFVTSLLEAELQQPGPQPWVFSCGPELMLIAVQKLIAKYQVPGWLSLETPMACGFGACFSCVTKVRDGDADFDYKRVCVEGPIFPAADLILH
ncbi:MAG: dihydroorotate dehydrogenase electron transfer subunit [Planctomycetaceae bacterium]|nr:dihydroorotate dehydrogenase electron transfer subunit [Planctomycetaceae bacterium]